MNSFFFFLSFFVFIIIIFLNGKWLSFSIFFFLLFCYFVLVALSCFVCFLKIKKNHIKMKKRHKNRKKKGGERENVLNICHFYKVGLFGDSPINSPIICIHVKNWCVKFVWMQKRMRIKGDRETLRTCYVTFNYDLFKTTNIRTNLLYIISLNLVHNLS